MSVAIIMMTTFRIDPESRLHKAGWLVGGQQRKTQYIDGLRNFTRKMKKYKLDTYIIDNSSPFDELPNRIKRIITRKKITYINNTPNNLGKINKGAGLIEAWKDNLNLMAKYDWIIHFEPRQKMVADKVVDAFFQDNMIPYFKRRTSYGGLETGFFIMRSSDMIEWINRQDAQQIANSGASLEHRIDSFLREKNIRHAEVTDLGLMWYHSYYKNWRSI